MLSGWLFFAGLALCMGLSVYLRMRGTGYRQDYVLTSPLAEALRQLVGIAGGIYLSLVMLAGFLGLELPERILIYHMQLDPLAVVSILLACVQPLVLAVLCRIHAGGGG